MARAGKDWGGLSLELLSSQWCAAVHAENASDWLPRNHVGIIIVSHKYRDAILMLHDAEGIHHLNVGSSQRCRSNCRLGDALLSTKTVSPTDNILFHPEDLWSLHKPLKINHRALET
jgi:hypothetical protein